VYSLKRNLLGKHFNDLSAIVRELSILLANTYNFNECGFKIGIGGAQDVVTIETFKVVLASTKTNRDFTTIVDAVNAKGETIPLLCIIKGATIQHKHVS
jgi:hypothetical protein